MNNKICLILLAAGSSSRMGRPKQLLPWGKESLIRHAVKEALASGIGEVLVIVGSSAELVTAQLTDLPVTVLFNTDWARGLGTSIHTGVRACQDRNADAVLILLGDQPFVSGSTLQRFTEVFDQSSTSLVATRYRDQVGVPALFGKQYFAELLSLPGEGGAKPLLAAHRSEVFEVNFPEAEWDIDTPADYANRLNF